MHSFDSNSNNIPAFIIKLWKLVGDSNLDCLIAWSDSGYSFVIKDQSRFAKELLPQYFKHNNMASFIRQLNMYSFKKVMNYEKSGLKNENDEMEFQNEFFLRGRPELLELIKRKIPNPRNIIETPMKSNAKDLLIDLTSIRKKQESMDNLLLKMKKENELLWRELTSMRQKHKAQEQIIQKVIQFLVSLVQRSNTNIGMQRKIARMLHDSPSKGSSSRTMDVVRQNTGDCIVVRPLGPTIHEVTEGDDVPVVTIPQSPDQNTIAPQSNPATPSQSSAVSIPLSLLEALQSRASSTSSEACNAQESILGIPLDYVTLTNSDTSSSQSASVAEKSIVSVPTRPSRFVITVPQNSKGVVKNVSGARMIPIKLAPVKKTASNVITIPKSTKSVLVTIPASTGSSASRIITTASNGISKPKTTVTVANSNASYILPAAKDRGKSNLAVVVAGDISSNINRGGKMNKPVQGASSISISQAGLLGNTTLIPKVATVLPLNITSMSKNVTSMPENITSVSKNITSMPENITSMPENITLMPENITSMPENITSMSENITLMSENITSTPEDIISIPDVNSIAMNSDLADVISEVVGDAQIADVFSEPTNNVISIPDDGSLPDITSHDLFNSPDIMSLEDLNPSTSNNQNSHQDIQCSPFPDTTFDNNELISLNTPKVVSSEDDYISSLFAKKDSQNEKSEDFQALVKHEPDTNRFQLSKADCSLTKNALSNHVLYVGEEIDRTQERLSCIDNEKILLELFSDGFLANIDTAFAENLNKMEFKDTAGNEITQFQPDLGSEPLFETLEDVEDFDLLPAPPPEGGGKRKKATATRGKRRRLK